MPYCPAASAAISQLPRCPPKTITGRPAASARSRCSRPAISVGPLRRRETPGGNTRIRRRCGYSAATRPRLSHMPRTTLSTRVDDSSGNAARRLFRARRDIARWGPIWRARAPPSAEATATGRVRIAAKNTAAPHASARYLHDEAAPFCALTGFAVIGRSAARRAPVVSMSRSIVVSVARPAQELREKVRHGRRVAPLDRDLEHEDRLAHRRAKAHPILCGGDQAGAGAVRLSPQPGDLSLAEAMVIRKRVRRDHGGADRAQAGDEFLRPANAGKGDHPDTGQVFSVHRFEPRTENRPPGLAQFGGRGAVADQHDRVGAGKPPRNGFAPRPGPDDAPGAA